MSKRLNNPFNSLQTLTTQDGRRGYFYSLPALEAAGLGDIKRLPVSIRMVLESVLRSCDGKRITEDEVKTLASWNAKKPSLDEIPFVVSRIVLQDFTGVPLLVDLASMRDAVSDAGGDPSIIDPLVPVDLVIDHSVQVDRAGTPQAFLFNLEKELERNRERYEFLKWGQDAFDMLNVVPPAIGIVHQVNLEYLAKVVFEKEVEGELLFYPDSLVGTDSHTTMINGLGVVGWGVGGIEAEAGMLGQPVYFQTPEVIGVHLSGALVEGVTATDLTLRITQLLRSEHVVGKFVEFFGEGAAALSVADRATIGNMAPEYGATMGYFPVDEKTLEYLESTGRSKEQIALVHDYLKVQGLFGIPREGEVDYTRVLELDMGTVVPCVSGPKRPQDRIDLPHLKDRFEELFTADVASGGFGLTAKDRADHVTVQSESWKEPVELDHGSVAIAAITSCTNTSNPSVMVAAGLVAKKAVEKGLQVKPGVKTSLAPGSRVVTDYLEAAGLQQYFDALGFNLVGYGCTTCIGNSGPLDPAIEKASGEKNLVLASVLSGNRNFEARIHGAIKGNFLMSPPLVVAFALAGRVDIDLADEPISTDSTGQPVYLKDLWPTHEEVLETIRAALKPEMFLEKYGTLQTANKSWNEIPVRGEVKYDWNAESTYIQNPPYFEKFTAALPDRLSLAGMRPLALLGDSVTTDHISPAGQIPADGPAGKYLQEHGVKPIAFNSFGSRRGNDRVMTRGTFANVRIRNRMAGGKEGGWTRHQPSGELMSIFEAAKRYAKEDTPLIVFAGEDYGMGSSRDWAAKGTLLLGVRAVVATSFERIHRSNLIGMGVLPLEFDGDINVLSLDGTEVFTILGVDELKPRLHVELEVTRVSGEVERFPLSVRIDTAVELDYYRNGGILPYVLRALMQTR